MDAGIDLFARDNLVSLRSNSFQLLKNLLQVIGLKDQATLRHSNRVHALTKEWVEYMRRQLKWTSVNTEALELSALIHDVGKIGILDEILLKPGSLSPEERIALEQHSEIGYQMIRDFPGIDEISLGVRHHHERWDGRGYPLGLKENRIPELAQIISIVDAFDAMTSERSYKKARSEQEALKEIENEAGRQFSPEFSADFIRFMHARNT